MDEIVMELCEGNNYVRTMKFLKENCHDIRRLERFMKFMRYKKQKNHSNKLSFEMIIDEEPIIKRRSLDFPTEERV